MSLMTVVGFCEIWLPIEGFIGYEVSNFGQVRSFKPANGRGPLKTVPRLLKQGYPKGKPYLRAGLNQNKRTHWFPVHSLVLKAFHGSRPSDEHEACHNDGNTENNHWLNLRWDTRLANAADRVLHGTQVRGEAITRSVLTLDQVIEIKAAIPIWKRGMGRLFAKKFGVGDSAIHSIKIGQTWSHV